MDNRFYFGFNTSEERKKRRKAELYSMSEQVSTFFWDEAPQHGLEMREGQQDMSFEIVDALITISILRLKLAWALASPLVILYRCCCIANA